jgi:cell division protein FtsL
MSRVMSEPKRFVTRGDTVASGRTIAVGRLSIVDLATGLLHHPAGVMAVMLALAALAVTIYLIQVSQVATLGYQLAQAQARELQLQVEAETLRTMVAEYERPARIQAVASDQLGLVLPERTIYLSVEGLAAQEDASGLDATNRWWEAFSGLGNGK